MNSNLYTAPRKFCLHIFTYFLVVSLLFSLGTAIPVASLAGVVPGQTEEKPNLAMKNMFLRTESQKTLEILENGTVRGTDCGNSRHSLLQSGSHNLGNTVFGIAAKRFLCVKPDGIVYSTPKNNFNEEDCVFNETTEYKTIGNKSEPNVIIHSKYRHIKHGVRYRNKVRKYHLALVCNKAVTISIKKHRQKYKNETLFLVERTDIDLESLTEVCTTTTPSKCKRKKCSEQIKKNNKRSHVKFCQKVLKNFFSANLKQLRLFRNRNCYTVLKEFNKCQRDRRPKRKKHS